MAVCPDARNAGMILPMTDAEEPSPTEHTATPRTVVPFIAAVAVIVVIVGAIVIAGIMFPAEDNVTEADRIQVAVTDFIGAYNDGDEQQKRGTECDGFDEKKSPLVGRDGKIVFDRVESPEVNGDRAKAQVTTSADDQDTRTDNWNFERSDGKWRVCN